MPNVVTKILSVQYNTISTCIISFKLALIASAISKVHVKANKTPAESKIAELGLLGPTRYRREGCIEDETQ